MHISWLTIWTQRFVHCSFQDKFGEKRTRTAPRITFTSNHKTVDETSKIQITSETRLALPLLILSHYVYLSLNIYLIVKSYWTRLSMIWRIMLIPESVPHPPRKAQFFISYSGSSNIKTITNDWGSHSYYVWAWSLAKFVATKRKMSPKELPEYLVPHLLIAYIR